MKVRSFMTPASEVVWCNPDDPLNLAISRMMEHNVGSIIIMPSEENAKKFPVGIVTKTDLLRGWQSNLDLHGASVREVMGTVIETILDTDSKDKAAEHFDKTRHRHAFVVDKGGDFVGIVSALDIATECAKDNKAWPYMNRDVLAQKFKVPTSPKCATKPPVPPVSPTQKHTFLDIAGAKEEF
jgi:CBS domain-containing protein